MPDIDADSYLDERDPELELPAHPETPVTPELLERLASIVGAECVFVDEPHVRAHDLRDRRPG